MDHNDIRHKLSEYIDDVVSPSEKAAIEEHLKTCTNCSDALRELRMTIEHLRSVGEIEPPVWLQQKIMAKVRAEAERKQSVFHRLFYPLSIKLPIQTVAVLFLAVTAFYIYRSIQPEMKYSEAPVTSVPEMKQEAPARESPPSPNPLPAGERTKERSKAAEIRRQPEQARQEPGYKSLDMKYEYEKPAAPVPKEQAPAPASAAPAPMKKELARSAKDEAVMERSAGEPKAKTATPSVMAEGAGRSTNIDTKKEAKPVTNCLSYEPTVVTISGVISKQDFPGPPEYRSIEEGDKKETYWILKPAKHFCVREVSGDSPNTAEIDIGEVQLVFGSKVTYDSYRELLNKPVIVQGTLFHAFTIHHKTTILLKVQDITEKH